MIASALLLTFLSTQPAAAWTQATPSVPAPQEPAQDAQQEPSEVPPLEWFEGSYEELLEKAKTEQRPVFLHFWAKWSRRTQVLYAQVFQADESEAALAGYLGYTIDVLSPEGKPLASSFNAQRPPRMIFLSPEGEIVDLIGDISDPVWMTAEVFVAEVLRIRSGIDTIPSLEARIAETPDDVDLRFELALKLRKAGNGAAFTKQVARIRELDPDGTSLPLRTLQLEQLSNQISDHKLPPARKATAAQELAAFIERETDRNLLFKAWQTLGTYNSQEAINAKRLYEHDKARQFAPQYVACWREALPLASELELEQMGPYVSITIFELRDYMKEPEKAFALEITSGLIEQMPENVDLMDAHACSLYMNGKPDEAIALLRKARTVDPSNWILQERIRAFQQ